MTVKNACILIVGMLIGAIAAWTGKGVGVVECEECDTCVSADCPRCADVNESAWCITYWIPDGTCHQKTGETVSEGWRWTSVTEGVACPAYVDKLYREKYPEKWQDREIERLQEKVQQLEGGQHG